MIECVDGVVDDGYDVLAVGFVLAEGPTVDPAGTLWVSDAARGGVHRIGHGPSETHLPDRRGIGGLAAHASGMLLAAGCDVAVVNGRDAHGVLTDPGAAGFNDLGAGPNGELLAGVLRYRPFRGEDPVPGTVRVVDVDGQHRALDGAVTWPNGIAVSATGWVYVADFAAGVVLRASWSDTGNPLLRPWWRSPSGQADGLAVDAEGCVLVAMGTGGSFARVRPDGSTDGIHPVPAGFVSSVCFAGPDLRELIITTGGDSSLRDARGGRVLRGAAAVPGLPVPLLQIPIGSRD
jgi:sugar lactone lactonase YvrE